MSDKSVAEKNLTVIVAHDYICPWCWVGWFQALRLKNEFPQLEFDWRGYELLPEGRFEMAPFKGPRERDPSRPLSRFELHAQSEGVAYNPFRTIGAIRSHNALEGAEYAKQKGAAAFEKYNEGVYRAYWEGMRDISDINVLKEIALNAGLDAEEFSSAVAERRYHDRIVPFDDEAYADDITHVPTFQFRGERAAEAPYSTIRDLAQRFLVWYDK